MEITRTEQPSAASTRPAAVPPSTADEEFWRVVGGLFPPSYLFGAGVLLGSYDEES
jgi:hypothetical protein